MPAKILVVDDEEQSVRLIADVLRPMGFDVLGLSDSRMASDQVRRQKFDAAFVDVRMPFVDGFELALRIRASPSNSQMPIVLMTGFDDVELMRKGFRSGVTFFLNKPFKPENLRGLLSAMQAMILKERRRYVRLPLRTFVTIQQAGRRYALRSVNLSQSGMLLESSEGLEVGQELDLEFSLGEKSKTVHAHSRVVRKDASGRIALFFLGMAEEDRQAIADYIAGIVKP